MKHHLRHMAIGGGLVLVVLLVLRVDLRTALQYALLLACPLGMVGMMAMMNRQGGHGHAHDGHDAHAQCHDQGAERSEQQPDRSLAHPSAGGAPGAAPRA